MIRGFQFRGYRLPTEAEWEYACRAESTTHYSFGNDEADLITYAWFDEAPPEGKTHPVGHKRRNAFGLYDMHGNVWEWCWDGFDPNYYKQSPDADPSGPADPPLRVCRGGSWNFNAFAARSANRGWRASWQRLNNVGFRPARTAQPTQ